MQGGSSGAGSGRAPSEGRNLGAKGVNREGHIAGNGNVGALFALKKVDQGGKGNDFDHEGLEVAGQHLNAFLDCDFEGNEIDFGQLDFEIFAGTIAALMEIVVHDVSGQGDCEGGGCY